MTQDKLIDTIYKSAVLEGIKATKKDVEDVFNMIKKVKDILNIVTYTYNTTLDENSLSYERFITHLRFFFKRLEGKEENQGEEEDFLLNQVKVKYKKAYECMLKIEKYLGIE